MATVNKNFRIKNGLVVEGSTATVNGQNILVEGGSDSYIIDLIGGQATSTNTPNAVVKRDGSGNFSAGTITANLTGNVTGNVTGNLTGNVTGNVTGDVTGTVSSLANHDTDDLTEGSNQYFTDARAKTSAADLLTNANLTNITITGNGAGLTITAENGVADSNTDDLVEGSSNLYFTNGRARNAISAGTGITYNAANGIINVSANTYDAYGAASAAQAAAVATASADATSKANAAQAAAEATASADATTKANAAQAAAISAAASDATTKANAAQAAAIASSNSYTDGKVADLVDSAPDLLNTLNELAAAIGDDANFASTLTASVGTKVSKAGDTMTGLLVLSADPAAALGAATKQYVDAAETAAASDATDKANAAQAAAEATAQAALNNVLDGDTDFTALDVNSVSRQIAATTGNITPAAATTVISWAKADYRTAKILVKAKNGTHTHVSEVIATLDTSDNIALNEYAITTTNGSLMAVDADINGGNVRLRVTPVNNNTEVMAHATLLV